MDAPIDIVIDIIKRKMNLVNENINVLIPDYADGMLDAYEDLIKEFEGYKRLFN